MSGLLQFPQGEQLMDDVPMIELDSDEAILHDNKGKPLAVVDANDYHNTPKDLKAKLAKIKQSPSPLTATVPAVPVVQSNMQPNSMLQPQPQYKPTSSSSHNKGGFLSLLGKATSYLLPQQNANQPAIYPPPAQHQHQQQQPNNSQQQQQPQVPSQLQMDSSKPIHSAPGQFPGFLKPPQQKIKISTPSQKKSPAMSKPPRWNPTPIPTSAKPVGTPAGAALPKKHHHPVSAPQPSPAMMQATPSVNQTFQSAGYPMAPNITPSGAPGIPGYPGNNMAAVASGIPGYPVASSGIPAVTPVSAPQGYSGLPYLQQNPYPQYPSAPPYYFQSQQWPYAAPLLSRVPSKKLPKSKILVGTDLSDVELVDDEEEVKDNDFSIGSLPKFAPIVALLVAVTIFLISGITRAPTPHIPAPLAPVAEVLTDAVNAAAGASETVYHATAAKPTASPAPTVSTGSDFSTMIVGAALLVLAYFYLSSSSPSKKQPGKKESKAASSIRMYAICAAIFVGVVALSFVGSDYNSSPAPVPADASGVDYVVDRIVFGIQVLIFCGLAAGAFYLYTSVPPNKPETKPTMIPQPPKVPGTILDPSRYIPSHMYDQYPPPRPLMNGIMGGLPISLQSLAQTADPRPIFQQYMPKFMTPNGLTGNNGAANFPMNPASAAVAAAGKGLNIGGLNLGGPYGYYTHENPDEDEDEDESSSETDVEEYAAEYAQFLNTGKAKIPMPALSPKIKKKKHHHSQNHSLSSHKVPPSPVEVPRFLPNFVDMPPVPEPFSSKIKPNPHLIEEISSEGLENKKEKDDANSKARFEGLKFKKPDFAIDDFSCKPYGPSVKRYVGNNPDILKEDI